MHALPVGKSTYRWQGKIEIASEITLLIKTQLARNVELEAALTRLHPYDMPEILALPVTAGLPANMNWILDETGKK